MIPVAREFRNVQRQNINSVAIRKVSATTEMGKYLFLKRERDQKIWGEMVGSINNGTKHEKREILFPSQENGRWVPKTGASCQKRET